LPFEKAVPLNSLSRAYLVELVDVLEENKMTSSSRRCYVYESRKEGEREEGGTTLREVGVAEPETPVLLLDLGTRQARHVLRDLDVRALLDVATRKDAVDLCGGANERERGESATGSTWDERGSFDRRKREEVDAPSSERPAVSM